MTATAAQIAQVRRMVAEPTTNTYSAADIQVYIEAHPLEDARGEYPTIESTSIPGTLEANPDWTATYDLNAAAADIWEEKAALVAASYDFTADGGTHNLSQKYTQAMNMARHYRSRRSITTITQRPEPLLQGYEEELEDTVA